jgi:hypothetical protein
MRSLRVPDAAKRQPGVERRRDGTKGHAHIPDSFNERSGRYYCTGKQIVVPADVFGCAVKADIDPELYRTLQKSADAGPPRFGVEVTQVDQRDPAPSAG